MEAQGTECYVWNRCPCHQWSGRGSCPHCLAVGRAEVNSTIEWSEVHSPVDFSPSSDSKRIAELERENAALREAQAIMDANWDDLKARYAVLEAENVALRARYEPSSMVWVYDLKAPADNLFVVRDERLRPQPAYCTPSMPVRALRPGDGIPR